MLEILFTCGVIGLAVILSIHEIQRYRVAGASPEAIPYPRRRLARRLGNAVLISVTVLLVQFWPEELPKSFDLAWFGLCSILLLMIVLVTLRDLHETSVAVVRENERFLKDAEKSIRSVIPPEGKRSDKRHRGPG